MARLLATYNLQFPIIRETRSASNGEEHEETLKPEGFCVEIKRPRAKDVRLMDNYEGQEIGGSMALLARISNLDEGEVDLLDAADLGELGNLLAAVSGNGPKTGEAA